MPTAKWSFPTCRAPSTCAAGIATKSRSPDTLGRGVERVDVDSSKGRTVIKVVLPRGSSHDGDADIEVSVPKGSSVEVSAVSADVSSHGVLGTQRLKSVSGEVTADISGN